MNQQFERRVARVQEATRLGLGNRMADREQKIISNLVTYYRSGKVTFEMLFGGIAAISELRAIAHDADSDFMQATDDSNSLTQR